MNNIEKKFQLVTLLSQKPEWAEILQEAVKVQEQKEEEYKNKDYQYLGFEWYEVHGQPVALHQMVSQRILDITSSSRSSTFYKVKDPQLVKQVIKDMRSGKEKPKEQQMPKDLFNIIVGHDKVKWAFNASLSSESPVHILLVGPVATAKTLFLSELSRLPNSRYLLGSASTKAGIVDYLLEYRPTYLIIDELEKADGKDLSSLLSLMQTGIITRLKKHMREETVLKTWVFAGANSLKLPQELRSRFLIIRLSEYTKNEFTNIALSLLEREGVKDREYIVREALPYTRDVRDILKIGRIAKNKDEVDRIIQLMYKKNQPHFLT